MLECIQQIDRSFLVWVQSFGTPFLDRFWLIITEKENSLPLYLVMLFLAQRYLGWKRFGILVLFTVLLITVSDQFTNAFKNGFMRLRPCHDPEVILLLRPLNYCGGMYSFYSGHASNGFAAATFFALIFMRFHKAFRWLFFWAFLLAFSRIYLGVHYLSDIVVGTAFGLFWGSAFAFAYNKWILKTDAHS